MTEMEAAHPGATALGQTVLSGNLRGRGMFWPIIPACILAYCLTALPIWGPFWFLPFLGLISFFAVSIAWMFRVSGVYSIHPDGLAVRRGWRFLPYFGRRDEIFRWDEIVAVYRKLTSYYTASNRSRSYESDEDEHSYMDLVFRYEIATHDGRHFVLDSRLGEIMDTGDIILREVEKRLLPGLLNQYDRGESVAFGPILVSKDGLTLGPTFHDWTVVAGLSVKKGLLAVEIQRNATLWRVPLAAIPNVDLFFALLAQRQPEVWVAANPAHFPEQKQLGVGYRRRG